VNRPLRRVSVAVLALFGLLLVNVNYLQIVKADDYAQDQRNSRVLVQAYSQERGPIAVGGADSGTGEGGRTVLARSVATDGPLTYLRQYPGGTTYAHVTGFFSLVYGATAIERAANPILSGEDDRLFVQRLSDVVTGREPAGGSVLLTVDPAAQQAAMDGLGGKRGAAVALDPRTGAILAMASTPSYSPERLSSHDPADIRAYYEELVAREDEPLLNRALSQTYPPGSTFKVITAAAALAGGATPETLVQSPRELDLPQTDQNLRNFGGAACTSDPSTLADALRISCNTAFGALGLELGEQTLKEQAEAFGFGDESLRVPMPVAESAFPSELAPPSLAQSAIGQFDVRVTPLQMAMVAAGIANDGTVMNPYLVREVQAPDLAVLDRADPEEYREAVSPQVADQLTAMMQLVVERGSARRAQIPGVAVAGKTGTAQNAQGAAPHAWFIGFAPAQDPTVAVAVVVENGGDVGSEATGGAVAAPIARDVMAAVLRR
jgi:peptidoglycan glycosyltransferase